VCVYVCVCLPVCLSVCLSAFLFTSLTCVGVCVWVSVGLCMQVASGFDLLIINRYNIAWGIPDKWSLSLFLSLYPPPFLPKWSLSFLSFSPVSLSILP
jgi:hypothetical protein